MIRAEFKVKVDPIKTLGTLKASIQKRILKKAIGKAVKPIRDSVKSNAPRLSGALKTSISTKIVVSKGRGSVSGIVGPRSKYEKQRKGKVIRPVRYAKLVEYGAEDRPAKPYLRPAWESKKTQYLEIVRTEVAAGIKQELAKNKAK